MIISVWNQENTDNSKVLTTLLAAHGAYAYPVRITVLENSMSDHLLGDMMLGNDYSDSLREEGARFTSKGAGGSLIPFLESKYMKTGKSESLVEIVERGLYYIPQFNDGSKVAFDLDFYEKMFDYREQAARFSDHLLIATARQDNFTTMRIVEGADLVVVLLPPEEYALSRFLDNYRSIIKKCLFVCMVPSMNKCDERELSKKFDKRGSSLLLLRYSNNFLLSKEEGRLIDYVRGNIYSEENTEDSNFIKGIAELSSKLFGRNNYGISFKSTRLGSLLQKRYYDKNKDW